eukprot:gene51219-41834_t
MFDAGSVSPSTATLAGLRKIESKTSKAEPEREPSSGIFGAESPASMGMSQPLPKFEGASQRIPLATSEGLKPARYHSSRQGRWRDKWLKRCVMEVLMDDDVKESHVASLFRRLALPTTVMSAPPP